MSLQIKDRIPISIGAWCHPAQCLNGLKLRTEAFPFDWLSSSPEGGLEYVGGQIATSFCFQLVDLKYNQHGNVISGKYPETVFLHHDLLKNKPVHDFNAETNIQPNGEKHKNLIEAFKRRGNRFMETITQKKVLLIYSAVLLYFNNISKIYRFIRSIKSLTKTLNDKKVDYKLLIYLMDDRTTDKWHIPSAFMVLNNNKTIFIRKYQNGHFGWNRFDTPEWQREYENFSVLVKDLL